MTVDQRLFHRTSLWISFAGAAVLANARGATAAPVDDYVKSQMRKQHIPGLSIAVIKDRKLIKAAGYGLANVETKTPATAKTVYKIASLSKQFIASAVMLLVEEGKINLDDKISKYLDGTPESWKDITVRNLLTHTSGIPRDPSDYHPYKEQTPNEVVEAAYFLPLQFQPGEKFLYSNVGYYALAEIITKITGEPWDEFVAERLFAPAGLADTRTLTNSAIIPHRASGYDQADGKMINAENWIAVRPSAAFLSTAPDLAKWDIFMDLNNPLTASDQRLMRTPVTLNNGTTADYGFGWYADSFLGHARIHHDGQYPGFRSDYERFEDDKLSVIVLSNAGDPSVQALAVNIAGFYVPALKAPPFTASVKLSSHVVANGSPVVINFSAKDKNKASPKTVLEMEIWDASHKAVNKQNKTNEDFAAGEIKSYSFSWTPTKPGTYTINLGIYGPKWMPSYSWNEGMTTLTVN